MFWCTKWNTSEIHALAWKWWDINVGELPVTGPGVDWLWYTRGRINWGVADRWFINKISSDSSTMRHKLFLMLPFFTTSCCDTHQYANVVLPRGSLAIQSLKSGFDSHSSLKSTVPGMAWLTFGSWAKMVDIVNSFSAYIMLQTASGVKTDYVSSIHFNPFNLFFIIQSRLFLIRLHLLIGNTKLSKYCHFAIHWFVTNNYFLYMCRD